MWSLFVCNALCVPCDDHKNKISSSIIKCIWSTLRELWLWSSSKVKLLVLVCCRSKEVQNLKFSNPGLTMHLHNYWIDYRFSPNFAGITSVKSLPKLINSSNLLHKQSWGAKTKLSKLLCPGHTSLVCRNLTGGP